MRACVTFSVKCDGSSWREKPNSSGWGWEPLWPPHASERWPRSYLWGTSASWKWWNKNVREQLLCAQDQAAQWLSAWETRPPTPSGPLQDSGPPWQHQQLVSLWHPRACLQTGSFQDGGTKSCKYVRHKNMSTSERSMKPTFSFHQDPWTIMLIDTPQGSTKRMASFSTATSK